MSRVIVLAVMDRNSADASDIFFSQLCLNNHQHNVFATGALCVKSKTVQMRKASILPPPPPHTHTRQNDKNNKLRHNFLHYHCILVNNKRIRQLFCIIVCVLLYSYCFKGKSRFLFHNLVRLFENFDFYGQSIRIDSRILFVKAKTECAEPFRLWIDRKNIKILIRRS